MDRKFLEGLSLEKGTIDQIMAEHGKTVSAEQAKVTNVNKERDTLKGQLDTANETIKSYKDMDIDAIKQSASDWEAKAKEHESELERVKQDAALDKALAATNTFDADLLKKALDHEALQFKDGKIIGLDEQLKTLQEGKPYLFKEQDPKEGQDNQSNGFDPYVPPAGDGKGASSMEQQIAAVFGSN